MMISSLMVTILKRFIFISCAHAPCAESVRSATAAPLMRSQRESMPSSFGADARRIKQSISHGARDLRGRFATAWSYDLEQRFTEREISGAMNPAAGRRVQA